MKITDESEAGFGAGYVSQRYGSTDQDPYQNVTDPEHWKKTKESETNIVVSGGGAEGKESKKERKARKRMLKKQQEKEEGMDKLSKKQKSKIRSKAMVGNYFLF